MSEHTPGPWHLADDNTIWALTPEGPRPLAVCEDTDADAALMTAAPDLFSALLNLTGMLSLFYYEDKPINDIDAEDFLKAAEAAVRKAEGRK